jgi:hypothetical protein
MASQISSDIKQLELSSYLGSWKIVIYGQLALILCLV